MMIDYISDSSLWYLTLYISTSDIILWGEHHLGSYCKQTEQTSDRYATRVDRGFFDWSPNLNTLLSPCKEFELYKYLEYTVICSLNDGACILNKLKACNKNIHIGSKCRCSILKTIRVEKMHVKSGADACSSSQLVRSSWSMMHKYQLWLLGTPNC